MAFNEHMADRIKRILRERKVAYEERKMFGGLCFMVDGKMCIGVEKERIMARIDPGIYDEALKRKGSRPMDFTGRIMKGYVFVDEGGVDMEEDLEYWVDLCLDFNPRAKASKK